MPLNLKQLLEDYNVPFSDSGSEISRGWIGLSCPWCGDDKTHLGYNEEKGLLTCWKCGPKRIFPTLKLLLGFDSEKIKRIMKKYGYTGSQFTETAGGRSFSNKNLIMPSGFGELKKSHRDYLTGRGFEPDEIVSKWNILGSGRKNCNGYENRIVMPIYLNKKLVSFHTRDITGEARTPKKACRMEDEVVHFKDTLYGIDNARSNTVIVTEGVFDVWRMGYGAVCTFGIKYSEKQVDMLNVFKNIFIMFDSSNEEEGKEEKQARDKAEQLADSLSIFHNVWIVDDLGSDPADMSQKKADHIKKKLLKIAKENEKF